MPPATAASNSRSQPAASAALKISVPTFASSSLFAVTTGLPFFDAVRISSRGRLDAADHLDDQIDRRIVDDVRCVACEETLVDRHRPLA